MGHQLPIGSRHIIGIKRQRTCNGKFLQEEIHVVALKGIIREIEVKTFNLVTIDASVALEVIVISLDREVVNPVTCHHASYLGQTAAHVVLHLDKTA